MWESCCRAKARAQASTGTTSSCPLLDKRALFCGPAREQSLDLLWGNAADGGVEITLNTFNNKFGLRSRAQSESRVLYGLSVKTECFIKSFLAKHLLKNTMQR